MSGCPFETRECPLFLASHVPASSGAGCCTGDWQRGCAVDRGADFDRLFARISVTAFAQMYGFTCRAIVGAGDSGLRRIWPWMFLARAP